MLPNDCSFWQCKIYADIRGVPWKGDVKPQSNHSGVIENVDFQCFQTLRLRNLKKRSQRYYNYSIIYSPLPFQRPQNT